MNEDIVAYHRDFSDLPDEALVNAEETSIELGITKGTLANWRCQGNFDLPVTKIGRLRKYRVGDIRAFKYRNRKSA